MDWRLEVVTIPVSNMDTARDFYADKVGFNVDIDHEVSDELSERGVDVGDVFVYDDGEYRPARDGESLDLVGVVFFEDPDGNRWTVQQIPPRK